MAQAGQEPGGDTAVGAVVIGRNEGPRLDLCLASMTGLAGRVVYVDSGSTDDSLEIAARHNADIVDLDLSIPFTAARARNAGFRRLMEIAPDVSLVQFVDGDCELMAGWLETAVARLREDEELCAVYGRVRERFPEKSVYIYLCDFEWNTPVGPSKYFGGNVMLRADRLRAVDGYREDMIAGEEPELAVRLRKAGWKIERVDADMVWHDVATTRFGQWWKRNVRSGYAYGQGAWMHGAPPERHFVRHMWSGLIWGGFVPLALCVSALANIFFLAGFFIYPVQVLRIWRRSGSLAFAYFAMLGKVPETQGIVSFWWDMLLGRRRGLIEHKDS